MNLDHDLAALPTLTVAQLRQRYADVFGEATSTRNKTWLIRRLAWRLQSLALGDLSQRARQRAAQLANDADLRCTTPARWPACSPLARFTRARALPSFIMREVMLSPGRWRAWRAVPYGILFTGLQPADRATLKPP